MKRSRIRRILGMTLILAMLATFLLSFGTVPAAAAPNSEITDRVELEYNGVRTLMAPGVGAFWEASFTAVSGAQTYRVLSNDVQEFSRSVSTTAGNTVYVRYYPFKTTIVEDSVTNTAAFYTYSGSPNYGQVSGNFSVFANMQNRPSDWATNNANGRLDYVGGGIYKKTFTLSSPTTSNTNFEYKINFANGWTYQIGNASGNNIAITAPSGTTSLTFWVDGINMICNDSVASAQVSFPGIGNARPCTVTVGTAAGDTLRQIGPTLYGMIKDYPAGANTVTPTFNGTAGTPYAFALAGASQVILLYDASNGTFYNSVTDTEAVKTLLGFYRPVTNESIDEDYFYDGELGAIYTPASTTFKVWSPLASDAKLNTYAAGTGGSATQYQMAKLFKDNGDWTGVWVYTLAGDCHKTYYTYTITTTALGARETTDIYSQATGVNGGRSMVVDLASTDPPGWDDDQYQYVDQITDAVIWELHVRDFSTHASSGISTANRGKYLAFTERGTTLNGVAGAEPTGMDYLADLGINYVHLLPTFDNNSTTDTSSTFNWGYDPRHYNVPRGQYASDPNNGEVRIGEYKQMVQAFHEAGIGVVFDCVYNHVGNQGTSPFHYTMPGYYFRYQSNGSLYNNSGCGNDTASERAMYRKFMVESVLYWATEYHIDGFRFDLMGLHDTDTMNAIRRALDDAGLEHVIMYGEGWNMASSAIPLPAGDYWAHQGNVRYLDDGIAMFNDRFRDAARGHYSTEATTGFLAGNQKYSSSAAQYPTMAMVGGIVASTNSAYNTTSGPGAMTAWAQKPSQVISYTNCHDDKCLWDRLVHQVKGSQSAANYGTYDANIERMNRIAGVLTLTSPGASFLHAGEEMGRSKQGNSNSYNSSDAVNQIDWGRQVTFAGMRAYYKGLIRLKNAYSPFRDTEMASINTMSFNSGFTTTNTTNLIAYTMRNTLSKREWDTVAVVFNSANTAQNVTLTFKDTSDIPDEWVVVVDGETAGVAELGRLSGNTFTIPAQTSYVLVDAASFDLDMVGKVSEIYKMLEDYANFSNRNDYTLDSIKTLDDAAAAAMTGIVEDNNTEAEDLYRVWFDLKEAFSNLDPVRLDFGAGQPAALTLKRGQVYQIKIDSNNKSEILFFSANGNVSLGATGLVTGVKPGIAIITVVDTWSGQFFNIVINVTN